MHAGYLGGGLSWKAEMMTPPGLMKATDQLTELQMINHQQPRRKLLKRTIDCTRSVSRSPLIYLIVDECVRLMRGSVARTAFVRQF